MQGQVAIWRLRLSWLHDARKVARRVRNPSDAGWVAGRQDIATFTAKCEKYVGTESGGMDQAISIMGQNGVAKMIEFNPVRPPPPSRSLRLPAMRAPMLLQVPALGPCWCACAG